MRDERRPHNRTLHMSPGPPHPPSPPSTAQTDSRHPLWSGSCAVLKTRALQRTGRGLATTPHKRPIRSEAQKPLAPYTWDDGAHVICGSGAAAAAPLAQHVEGHIRGVFGSKVFYNNIPLPCVISEISCAVRVRHLAPLKCGVSGRIFCQQAA